MPKAKGVVYQSFLLRCWQEQNTTAERWPVWRFMLQSVTETQEQHVFATFEQMVAFLRQKIIEETVGSEEA
jgi:hypothetical protein